MNVEKIYIYEIYYSRENKGLENNLWQEKQLLLRCS